MNRDTGAIVLLIGAALTYSLAFSQFDQRVSRFTVDEQGERIPITHVTCPSPWSVVVNGEGPDVIAGENICPMPARTLLAEAGLVVVISLLLGIRGLTRKRPEPIHELPRSIKGLWRRRVWRSRNPTKR